MWTSEKGRLPDPPWEWTERAERVVNKLLTKARTKDVTEVYIATDSDREGEFIAWRLKHIFSEFPFVTRVTFNEITKEAVEKALENHRDIDQGLVDKGKSEGSWIGLVGFRCSKFAKSWNLRSMGRVQTPRWAILLIGRMREMSMFQSLITQFIQLVTVIRSNLDFMKVTKMKHGEMIMVNFSQIEHLIMHLQKMHSRH